MILKLLWAICAYQFCVVELQSLLVKPTAGDTLAQHLYKWLKFTNKPAGYIFRRMGWVALLVLLIAASVAEVF